MYVCICNAIRETDLRAAALCCSGDADAVYNSLGRTPQCRQCIDDASDILMQERASASMSACA
ncbi:ferredoxin [Novosphingobium sp. G106]|uniref:(2Fe-2S)-binding protein n=1 Tax=Novosphingobium sp. G106 TaxID=2849500 RepID=UPI001C2DA9F1|nr:ferredoxin [Novosphingobium sp. G106]MBV1688638.1 ferredoxin [Novosphingobium sp. G106]